MPKTRVFTRSLASAIFPARLSPIAVSMEEVAKHVEKGEVRYVGVSNFDGALMDEGRKYVPIVSLQPPYSLLDRAFEDSIQSYCIENELGVLSYGSIGSGILSGKYSLENRPQFPQGDSRAGFYSRFYTAEAWPKVCAMVDVLRDIAAAHGAPPSSMQTSARSHASGRMSRHAALRIRQPC